MMPLRLFFLIAGFLILPASSWAQNVLPGAVSGPVAVPNVTQGVAQPSETVPEAQQTPAPGAYFYEPGEDVPLMPGVEEAPAVPVVAAPAPCGYQELVGRNFNEIDIKAFTVPVRVLYPDSAATMDYSPERINIILERGTDVVIQVKCG